MAKGKVSNAKAAAKAKNPPFKFEIGARVRLVESREEGVVIGRAEYDTSEDNYYVRYVAGDHRQTESWWQESALVAA